MKEAHKNCGQTGNFAERDYVNRMLWNGHTVEHVGVTNIKNGADAIVDGKPVQVKACNSAEATAKSLFEKGQFRYEGQTLAVPKDQVKNVKAKLQEKGISAVYVAPVNRIKLAKY